MRRMEWTLIISFLATVTAEAQDQATNESDGRWADTSSIEKNINNGDYGTVTSVLIMEAGQVVYQGYFNGADANSLHNTRSVTKTVTGMAVGAAVDEGLFTLATPAFRFFTDLLPFQNPDPRKMTLTVEDLITMTSILECDDNDQFSRGNESRMSIVEDWASFVWDLPIKGYPGWMETPKTAKYGRVFSYCSAGIEIAGQLVERASGKTFQTYVETKLFEPLKITQFDWQENGLGQAHKSGGLSLTALGLAKLADMHRTGGTYDGQVVLSPEWVEEAIRPRAVVYSDSNTEYGYTWWLAPYRVGDQLFQSYYMAGNGGNRVLVMPEHALTVVVTKTDYNTRGMHQKTNALIEQEIVARLTPRP